LTNEGKGWKKVRSTAQYNDLFKQQCSQLLIAWSQGDEAALEQLTPLIYDELHRLARRYMRREKPGSAMRSPRAVLILNFLY